MCKSENLCKKLVKKIIYKNAYKKNTHIKQTTYKTSRFIKKLQFQNRKERKERKERYTAIYICILCILTVLHRHIKKDLLFIK